MRTGRCVSADHCPWWGPQAPKAADELQKAGGGQATCLGPQVLPAQVPHLPGAIQPFFREGCGYLYWCPKANYLISARLRTRTSHGQLVLCIMYATDIDRCSISTTKGMFPTTCGCQQNAEATGHGLRGPMWGQRTRELRGPESSRQACLLLCFNCTNHAALPIGSQGQGSTPSGWMTQTGSFSRLADHYWRVNRVGTLTSG